jgi:hypothetical protein
MYIKEKPANELNCSEGGPRRCQSSGGNSREMLSTEIFSRIKHLCIKAADVSPRCCSSCSFPHLGHRCATITPRQLLPCSQMHSHLEHLCLCVLDISAFVLGDTPFRMKSATNIIVTLFIYLSM